jgi:protein phosphatase
MFPEEEIQRIVAEHDDPQRAADALVAAANAAGGVDNVTAVILFVLDGEEAGGDGAAQVGRPSSEPARKPEPPERGERPSRRRRPLRILAWTVVLAAVLAAAFMGARAYAFSQWYVGVEEGRVALFQGMPVEILGYRLHRAVEVTDLSATRAMNLRPWQELEEGITAESEEEARGIIDTIRRDLAEAERPVTGIGAGSG